SICTSKWNHQFEYEN
ncbi:unnamed protein product, partial [Rotaria sordida]